MNASPTQRIARRRPLPNGRAVIGALLVTVAAVGAFSVATVGDEGPSTEYLVIVDDIRSGETIELENVAFAAMHLSPAVAANALQSSRGLEGATALADLHAGSVLDVRDLAGATFVDGVAVTGVHELTIPVPTDRAPAAIRRGDRVTLLAYATDDGTVYTAAEDALVLRFDTEATGIGSAGEARLTLALPDADDVARLTRWSYQALTVVLTTHDLDDVYPDELAPPTTTTAFLLEVNAT